MQPVVLRAVVLLVLAVALAGMAGCGREKATPPASYTEYTAPDRAFKCLAPAGWETASSSSQAVASGVLFRKGTAVIDVTADLQGSLIGDIARGPALPVPDLPGGAPRGFQEALKQIRNPPVEKLHEMGQKEVAASMSHYDEQPMHTLQSRMGDARYSEFTAGGATFTPKIHGYRVTLLGGERRVTVIAHCPEADWSTLQPAFAKVIGSLGPGG